MWGEHRRWDIDGASSQTKRKSGLCVRGFIITVLYPLGYSLGSVYHLWGMSQANHPCVCVYLWCLCMCPAPARVLPLSSFAVRVCVCLCVPVADFDSRHPIFFPPTLAWKIFVRKPPPGSRWCSRAKVLWMRVGVDYALGKIGEHGATIHTQTSPSEVCLLRLSILRVRAEFSVVPHFYFSGHHVRVFSNRWAASPAQ